MDLPLVAVDCIVKWLLADVPQRFVAVECNARHVELDQISSYYINETWYTALATYLARHAIHITLHDWCIDTDLTLSYCYPYPHICHPSIYSIMNIQPLASYQMTDYTQEEWWICHPYNVTVYCDKCDLLLCNKTYNVITDAYDDQKDTYKNFIHYLDFYYTKFSQNFDQYHNTNRCVDGREDCDVFII
jgi:hypothetical protein